METVVYIFLIISLIIFGVTPLLIADNLKKSFLRDKSYKLFRIKMKLEELQQKLSRLEREIKEYEESFVDKQETEK